MTTHRAPRRSTLHVWIGRVGFVCALALNAFAATSLAQYDGDDGGEESSFTVNAMMKLQGGVFVPLASDKFSPHKNEAIIRQGIFDSGPCDPVVTPRKPCYPTNHGQKPGTPSITRATLQLEAHWDFKSWISLHAIVRGTRSMQLPADEYAQVPLSLERGYRADKMRYETDAELGDRRRAYAKRWVQENQYNTFELREFYTDIMPLDWLSFRIGRQQVAWGETGSFRLLDVINPINSTWHFGPLEAFEDMRIPLWMALANIEVTPLAGALELIYIPGVDKARDTVSTPLSMGGAWGVPYSNSPPTFRVAYRNFQYPGGKLHPDNMRYGVRWKGDLGEHASYSLVYTYTHMQTPVLQKVYMRPEGDAFSATEADRADINFPRQHIAGLSFEYAFPSPIALTARFEGAYEPNRTYSNNTDQTSNLVNGTYPYKPETKHVLNYAVVLQRPTMIRWLNPVQNFLLVAQFQHTHVFDVDDVKDVGLVQTVGFNDWRVQADSYTVVGYATTQYLHGLIIPRLTGAAIINPYYKDSGFISFDLGFRIGPHYRLNLTVTDFFGGNPYRDIGLFRDRDEVHASATVLF